MIAEQQLFDDEKKIMNELAEHITYFTNRKKNTAIYGDKY